jgi:16S rRNA (guanine527-N7)-methyltransferase
MVGYRLSETAQKDSTTGLFRSQSACRILGRMADVTEAGLLDLAREWSIELPPSSPERIGRYLRLLLLWNERVNLTGARDMDELFAEHLVDSFALCRLVPRDCSVIDVGSGGGLPAVPFSMLRPDCRVDLLEPRSKRIAFLNTVVRECGCRNASVVRGRSEDYKGGPFDVATSRATFSPDCWLGLAPSLLVPSGRIVVFTTVELRPDAGRLRLVDSLEYAVPGHATRWAGCYCST